MNQNMHTLIATALGILTVKFITQWYKFNETNNKFGWILFIVDVVVTLMLLTALFYYMNS